MDDEVQPNELRDWVTQLRGSYKHDESLVAKMRSLGMERLFPYLRDVLDDPDAELRCQAALAIFYVDPKGGIELLVPLLDDPEWIVRVEICGLLHDIADERAVRPLIQIMKSDPNPMVRNTAAYALGGIGDPVAIPALIQALNSDHEPDELGHCASGRAATALDHILETNHTRTRFADGLCTMQPRRLDLNVLKAEAMELYRNL